MSTSHLPPNSPSVRVSGRVVVISRGPAQTQAIGKAVGTMARAGDVILLVGGLGSGKTCLTQGILWGLGVNEYARSPTFVLVSQYRGRLPLYHVDLYRLDAEAEIADLELEEYLFGDGVCVVEWAEKARGIYQSQRLLVELDILDEMTRRLTLTALGERYAELIQAVAAMDLKG